MLHTIAQHCTLRRCSSDLQQWLRMTLLQRLTLSAATDSQECALISRASNDLAAAVLPVLRFYTLVPDWLERRRVLRVARENGRRSEVRARLRVVMTTRNI